MCAFLVWLPLWSLYRQPLVKITPPESTRIPPRIPPVPVLRHSCQSQAIFLVEQWFIMMFLNWFNKWNQTRSFHAESLYSFNWLGSEELRVLVQIWRYLSLQIKPIWSIWLTVAMMKNSSLSHLYCLMITCTVSGLTEMGYFHFTRNRQQETFCDKKETNFLWRAEFVGRKILETTFWHVSHWNPNLVDSSGINVLRLGVAHERYRVSHLDTPRWC